MIKKLTITSAALALLFLPAVSFAQNTNMADTETTITTSPRKLPGAIKEARMEAKEELKDKIAEARAAMKAKISEIKDIRKKTIVENIDSRIKTINENRTQQMLKHLDRLTTILSKVSSKEAALKSQGKDTTALSNSITLATTTIETAKTAVNAQAAKTYTATITTDEALKTAITTLLTQFKKDIKAAHVLVVTAQKAVSAAHKAAGLLRGETTLT